jgi:hypothetical protein
MVEDVVVGGGRRRMKRGRWRRKPERRRGEEERAERAAKGGTRRELGRRPPAAKERRAATGGEETGLPPANHSPCLGPDSQNNAGRLMGPQSAPRRLPSSFRDDEAVLLGGRGSSVFSSLANERECMREQDGGKGEREREAVGGRRYLSRCIPLAPTRDAIAAWASDHGLQAARGATIDRNLAETESRCSMLPSLLVPGLLVPCPMSCISIRMIEASSFCES